MRLAVCSVLVACTPAPQRPQPAPPAPAAALDPALDPMRPLVGTWEGSDPARRSSGQFSLVPDVGGKVLLRRNVNVSPEGKHEDLMIVFPSPAGLRAVYFDNEGHTIQYAVTASADRIEMLSDETPGAPRFKLTYDRHGTDELVIDFAIAMSGTTELKRYTGGTVHRIR